MWHARRSQARPQLAPGTSVRFASSADGTQIAFESAGQGAALAIVGDALSQRQGGKPFVSQLQRHFTVYTHGRRGRGDSGDTKPVEKMKSSPEWEGIRKIDFTLVSDYAVLGSAELPAIAKSITAPTLVMDGEKSIPFMRPTADRLAALIPGAQRETLPGQTHQAAAEIVAPLLIEFFGKPSSPLKHRSPEA